MNQAEIPPPNAPPPVLEIPADQIEVLPKGAAAGTSPAKRAELVVVEVAPKDVLPDRATQFSHKLLRASKVRGVEYTTGLRLVRVFAGPAEHTLVAGATWEETFPAGFDAPGEVFLTAVLRNEGKELVRGSVKYLLEELPEGEQAVVTEGTRGGSSRGRAAASQSPGGGSTRRGGGPPGVSGSGGMRRMVTPGSAAANGVRQGPARGAPAGAPTRTGVRTGAAPSAPRTGSRVGVPQNGPNPVRKQNATSPEVISPVVSSRERLQKRAEEKDLAPAAEGPIVLALGEVLVRVEAWRMPALRDLARRGVPLPPTHVGAVQNGIRKRGESPGVPFVLTEALAKRLLHVVTKGGKMTSEERDDLAARIEAGVSKHMAAVVYEEVTPSVVAEGEAAAPEKEGAT